MAMTLTLAKAGVIGDLQYRLWNVNCNTTASEAFATGLANVYMVIPGSAGATGAFPKLEKNTGSSGVEAGSVKITPVTNTDTFDLLVIGPA